VQYGSPEWRIAAVTSWGEPNCTGTTRYATLGASADFLEMQLADVARQYRRAPDGANSDSSQKWKRRIDTFISSPTPAIIVSAG